MLRSRVTLFSLRGGLLCPKDVMRRTSPLSLVLCLAALAASGCNYDPETRLFRQVVPKPEDVALAPPGAETEASESGNTVQQGLERCDEDTLRCHAENIASGLNALTAGLLAIVDGVVQLPPSQRDDGRRVWGPHFTLEQDATFRFEMVRADDGTFTWCLHAGRGDLTRAEGTEALDCGVYEAGNGMLLVLSGESSPGSAVGQAAGSGRGSMVLEGPRFRDLDPNAEEVGVITFVYDNTSGRDVTIDVEESEGRRGDLFGTGVTYRYTSEPDDSGTFYFAARANFVGGGGFGFDPVLEDFVIRSRWTAEKAGRADATVSGGDLDAGAEYSATQCWNTSLETVYLVNNYDDATSGDAERCAFLEPLPAPDDA